ncbi:MAG: HD domain-containing protein [Sedimentisphaerales bacterium]|nr:HD domain-containing protein [Sedimentisphaerales bacterium]
MDRQQLTKFNAWFDKYAAGFYGRDRFINTNLKLKEDHSRRVCEEMQYLAGTLALPDNQRLIAETIALFHDIGRFEQFTKYRTYNDSRSTDHCLLGLEVLRTENVLDGIDSRERELIEKAIEYHGRKVLPTDLDGDCLLFSKLIRDADKLDVYYVVTQYYRQYRDDPSNFLLELEFPDRPEYSPQIVDAILRGQLIDYTRLQTLNDVKLLQLGWVYDINFTASLKRIRQRRFLEMLLDFLPQTPDIQKVKEKIFAYVDFRIKQEQ